MYEIKGDNNNGLDLELVFVENVVGKYVDIIVLYVGYLLNYVNLKVGVVLFFIILGVFLFGYFVIFIFGVICSIDGEKKDKKVE